MNEQETKNPGCLTGCFGVLMMLSLPAALVICTAMVLVVLLLMGM